MITAAEAAASPPGGASRISPAVNRSPAAASTAVMLSEATARRRVLRPIIKRLICKVVEDESQERQQPAATTIAADAAPLPSVHKLLPPPLQECFFPDSPDELASPEQLLASLPPPELNKVGRGTGPCGAAGGSQLSWPVGVLAYGIIVGSLPFDDFSTSLAIRHDERMPSGLPRFSARSGGFLTAGPVAEGVAPAACNGGGQQMAVTMPYLPLWLSEDCRDFLTQALQRDPARRPPLAELAATHSWLNDLPMLPEDAPADTYEAPSLACGDDEARQAVPVLMAASALRVSMPGAKGAAELSSILREQQLRSSRRTSLQGSNSSSSASSAAPVAPPLQPLPPIAASPPPVAATATSETAARKAPSPAVRQKPCAAAGTWDVYHLRHGAPQAKPMPASPPLSAVLAQKKTTIVPSTAAAAGAGAAVRRGAPAAAAAATARAAAASANAAAPASSYTRSRINKYMHVGVAKGGSPPQQQLQLLPRHGGKHAASPAATAASHPTDATAGEPKVLHKKT